MAQRIAIVGGGPAGLSLARLLREQTNATITVFEAAPRPGGKSFSFLQGDAVVEMGTCYTTRAHRIVLAWMKETGINLKPLREQSFDGEDFLDYVKRGDGSALPFQILSFLAARRSLMARLSRTPVSKATRQEAAQTTADWLRARNLHKIERFMYRSMTNLGYGFVDETPIVQAMRWNDFDLILTGLLKQLKMPVEGWTAFWERIAKALDVRTNTPIAHIERNESGARLTTASGDVFEADQLVCAIAIDDFAKLLDVPLPEEEFAASAMDWNGYTTTLVATPEKFTDMDVTAWSRALVPGARTGQMMSARYDGYEPDLGGHLYLTGQLSGAYSDDELEELLREEITREGGEVTNIILQRTWKYFARYKSEAVREGLLTRLEEMQGQRATWYTGSAFSHEAVSNIVNFNAGLARKMQAAM
ncbi:FAD-dependent oxidoreductase [Henriciella marina]|uniref:FAD-dependent oxidoreductase n=1 Tax=Henriciella marina TaxID=453851 RepID=UPI0014614217|nr:FAD-dependent oxidoreductase [Henriciella marina]